MIKQHKIYTKLFITPPKPDKYIDPVKLQGLATNEQLIQLLKDHSDMRFYWYDTDQPITFQNINNVVDLTKVNERWN